VARGKRACGHYDKRLQATRPQQPAPEA
jgi:hypothetical protein